MSVIDSESKASEREDASRSPDAPSDDDNDSSDSGTETQQTEWLATARERRSTAGNRMKSMLANEEPDSDLELLFAEDEDDQGFSDAEDAASDVQMDSSSDDEDENNAADDDAGEKELERQAKERRAAQRKRKAQDAIPAKFRKKVRIDSTTPAAPAPRPKKKSERASWLPSPADLPTRASSRQTTRLSKEQLHQQMVQREAKRLKQLAQMQKKAARLEALKKPPMTQEDRLREAGMVEKRNSKSLNRWEEAEKQREEERRAKLAALNNRTLKGPVLTFWSGKGEWIDGKLRHVGRHVVIEEKPKKKKEKGEKGDKEKGEEEHEKPKNDQGQNSTEKGKEEKNTLQREPENSTATKAEPGTEGKEDEIPARDADVNPDDAPKPVDVPEPAEAPQPDDTLKPVDEPRPRDSQQLDDTPMPDAEQPASKTSIPAPEEQEEKSTAQETHTAPEKWQTPPEALNAKPSTDGPSDPPPTAPSPLPSPTTEPKQGDSQRLMAMPQMPPPATTLTPPPPSVFPSGLAAPAAASDTQGSLQAPCGMTRPQESKPSGVLAAPVLAPPPGIGVNGTSSPKLGYGSAASKSNVLALPDTTQRFTPPSIPGSAPGSSMERPATSAEPVLRETHFRPIENQATPDRHLTANSADQRPGLPPNGTATRNAIVFQNFDENSIKDRGVQTQILFGRKMSKLSKPSPLPLCVITNHPARYRDPITGLPYFNAHAYREIQRLRKGEYRWSKLLGAWVGSGSYAARGVPERFLNPAKKKADPGRAPDAEKGDDEKPPANDDGGAKAPVEKAETPEEKDSSRVEGPTAAVAA